MEEKREKAPARETPLRAARRRARLSQPELARRANVSLRTVQRMEAGDAIDVKLNTVYRLAWVLGCERMAEIVDPLWLEWQRGGAWISRAQEAPNTPAPVLD